MNLNANLVFLVICSTSVAQEFVDLPAPKNVSYMVTSNAVTLTWNAVENATSYIINLSGTQTKATENTRVVFGGLDANSKYNATVAAADINGTSSTQTSSVTFTTLLSQVKNLKITDATASSMELTWDESPGAISHKVMVSSDGDQMTGADVFVEDNVMFISNLTSMTFYKINVVPVSSAGDGDIATIRGRTDGSGVTLVARWSGVMGPIGGEAQIYRPLTIPAGPFRMRVLLPCPIVHINFWNADLNQDASRAEQGMFVIEQTELWQRNKPEVGMTFYFRENAENGERTACEFFDDDSITVDFDFGQNADLIPRSLSQNTKIPVVIQEWWSTTDQIVNTGGSVILKLSDVYSETNERLNSPENSTINPKPLFGKFAISIDSGANCSGGITINSVWGMTQKSAEGMKEVPRTVFYFVQTEMQWPSNDLGFIYGYDPAVCEDRDGVTAEIIEGGSIVDILFSANNIS
ncbi:unnamed protein product [Clavelina lepadiformis]|uniref:Fibronectin type-III domain-containing protein n=1 Tax=Clavelina lepadiformis TaxID=159417 RepID=A0ABP0FX74_CLALP